MKKRQIILYMAVMLILLTTSVYATISGELGFKVTTKSNAIYPGDEFSITVSLKDLQTTGKIKAVEGYIDINEEILENLTVENIETNSDGKVEVDDDNILTVYDSTELSTSSETGIIFNTDPASEEGDYRVVINFANPIDEDTDLITLNFKVKEDAKPGEYSSAIVYKIFKVFSEDAKEKQELTSKGIKVIINRAGEVSNNTAIGEDNRVDNTPENVPENRPENGTTNRAENRPENRAETPEQNLARNENQQQQPQQSQNQGGTGTQSGGQTDGTVSPSNLPKAGYKLILIPIIAVAILGYVFYKKYSKYNYHE